MRSDDSQTTGRPRPSEPPGRLPGSVLRRVDHLDALVTQYFDRGESAGASVTTRAISSMEQMRPSAARPILSAVATRITRCAEATAARFTCTSSRL